MNEEKKKAMLFRADQLTPEQQRERIDKLFEEKQKEEEKEERNLGQLKKIKAFQERNRAYY